MNFSLDIRLPIGIRVKAEVKKSFYGIMKSLLVEILRDLEEGNTKHTSYFLSQRISKNEKKVLIALLREIEKEKDFNFSVSNEDAESFHLCPSTMKALGRYSYDQ